MNPMKTTIACLAATFLLAGAACAQTPASAAAPAPATAAAADHGADERAATDVATRWLGVLDAGNYPDAWRQLAPAAQAMVTQQAWNNAMPQSRGKLGAVKSRTLKGAEYTDAMPGAPAGEYVGVAFDTVFANGAKAVETVVPMRTPDGGWKVSGYFVN